MRCICQLVPRYSKNATRVGLIEVALKYIARSFLNTPYKYLCHGNKYYLEFHCIYKLNVIKYERYKACK